MNNKNKIIVKEKVKEIVKIKILEDHLIHQTMIINLMKDLRRKRKRKENIK